MTELKTVDTKKWYQSTTILGAVLAFVSSTLGAYFKLEIPDSLAPALATDATAAIGAIIALVGRLKAVKRIK